MPKRISMTVIVAIAVSDKGWAATQERTRESGRGSHEFRDDIGIEQQHQSKPGGPRPVSRAGSSSSMP
jgi:hypothetical protein